MTNIYNRPEPLDLGTRVSISKAEHQALLRNQKKLPAKYLRRERFKAIDGEIWSVIPGTINYEISNLGRVRKCYRDKYNTYYVVLVHPKSKVNGFYRQRLNLGSGNIKEIYIHKVVGDLYVPKVIDGWIAYHIDGNKENNRAANIGWRPRKVSNAHAGKLKTIPYVSKMDGTVKLRRSKLSPGDIKEICRLLNSKLFTQKQISETFSVSQSFISHIKSTGFRFIEGKAVPYNRIPNEA